MNSLRVSVAIPVHNEQAVMPELLRRTTAVLDQLPGGPHEIVFVDDGSTDRTLEVLEQAAARDPRILIIALSRNFGHQAAITAALDYSSGDATVVMDGDLQDLPEAIPAFVEKFREGYDVVFARRVKRKEPWWLQLSYWFFYRLVARLASIQLPLDAGDFGLMSARVVEHLRKMPEHHRYVRGLRTWVGFCQTAIDIERSYRFAGRTKYTPFHLLKLASDGIFSFSVVPIRAALIAGLLALGLCFAYALYSLVAKMFFDQAPRGFTALIWVITFVTGVHLLFLGIIGEYVGRVYEEIKARPIYIVSKMVGKGRAITAAGPRA